MRPAAALRGGLPLLLGLALTSCALPAIPEPKFTPAGEKRLRQLEKALRAESFQVGGGYSIVNDSTNRYVTIDILNAEGLAQPDTLQLKQLARTVVRGLRNAREFQAVQVSVQETHDYLVASTNRSQTTEYTMRELQ